MLVVYNWEIDRADGKNLAQGCLRSNFFSTEFVKVKII
jgi:hypothetical protein